MRILALDLGTKTGWALLDAPDRRGPGKVSSGTWKLMTADEVTVMRKAGKDRCCDPRASRLLEHIKFHEPLDEIWFEDVQFSKTQLQAQLWGTLRGVVWLFNGPKCKLHCIPTGTLKKLATGNGASKKDGMKLALTGTIEPGILSKMDDNEVDAYHLLCQARLSHMNES